MYEEVMMRERKIENGEWKEREMEMRWRERERER